MTHPTVQSQVKLVTGKQEVTCETCGKTMNINVGGVQKQGQRRFRPYRGTCRGCSTMYTAVKNTRNW